MMDVRGGPETAAWLKPLLDEARKRNIDIGALIHQSAVPAPEDSPARLFFGGTNHHTTDWPWLGYLLRRQLGWEDTYPGFSGAWDDFPEVPDIP
jgi:hypothetical protein